MTDSACANGFPPEIYNNHQSVSQSVRETLPFSQSVVVHGLVHLEPRRLLRDPLVGQLLTPLYLSGDIMLVARQSLLFASENGLFA